METISYFLLTNEKKYYMSKSKVLKYSKWRLAQFDKLYIKDNMYYIEYDVDSFEDMFEYLRGGGTKYTDVISFNITSYILGRDVELDWRSKYMQPDAVDDALITIKLIANQKEYKVLYSTLCRFPKSSFAKLADNLNYFDIDINLEVFEWMLALYRGSNTPYTLPGIYKEPIPNHLIRLAEVLKAYGLPDGITGEHDMLLLDNFPKMCPKCKYVTHKHIYTKSFKTYGLTSELIPIKNHINYIDFCAIPISADNSKMRKILYDMYTKFCTTICVSILLEKDVDLFNFVFSILCAINKEITKHNIDKEKQEKELELKESWLTDHVNSPYAHWSNNIKDFSLLRTEVTNLRESIETITLQIKQLTETAKELIKLNPKVQSKVSILRPLYLREYSFEIDKCQCA